MQDSAQRVFIGWMQTRQRDIIVLVSLGCVTASFVQYVSSDGGDSATGTFSLLVKLIPVTVHLLLVWDLYVKWDR